jgi:hypothetical protein
VINPRFDVGVAGASAFCGEVSVAALTGEPFVPEGREDGGSMVEVFGRRACMLSELFSL